jgi:hypothetical protein
VRDGYDPDALPERFRENVYAASEALTVLADADARLGPDTVFDRVRDRIPAWERARSADWEDTWRRRIERILDWAVLFGLAEGEDGYASV